MHVTIMSIGQVQQANDALFAIRHIVMERSENFSADLAISVADKLNYVENLLTNAIAALKEETSMLEDCRPKATPGTETAITASNRPPSINLPPDVRVGAYRDHLSVSVVLNSPIVRRAMCAAYRCKHQDVEVNNWDFDDSQMLAFAARLAKQQHLSPFELVQLVVEIRNLSRAGLAQLTRHRHGSFMVSSQHFGANIPLALVSKKALQDQGATLRAVTEAAKAFLALPADVPAEYRRMSAPNAMACHVTWATNLRELATFIRHRACKDNVEEMQLLARLAYKSLLRWFADVYGQDKATMVLRPLLDNVSPCVKTLKCAYHCALSINFAMEDNHAS